MNTAGLVPENQVAGEDARETSELRAMLQEAKDYIASWAWGPPIAEAYMGMGIGGVIGVWLLRLAEKVGDQNDEYLWVVTGDVPSAYFVTDDVPGPLEALDVYCRLMTDWANAVKRGEDLSEVFPVRAPADAEHADMLLSRVRFIRERIIPRLQAE